MSRILAIIVSLFYVAGGLVTGYYAYALRLQAQASEAGMDMTMLSDFVQTNYAFVGPVLLVLAFLFHMSQIFNARRVDKKHVNAEAALQMTVQENREKLEALEAQVTENGDLIKFCRDAISNAANTKTTALAVPAKDYPDEGN